MLIINKNIILYRVFDDEKEVRIYNIFSQRQDYFTTSARIVDV